MGFFIRNSFHLFWFLHSMLLLTVDALANGRLSCILFKSLGFSAEFLAFRILLLVKSQEEFLLLSPAAVQCRHTAVHLFLASIL